MIMEKLRATFYCENCRPCFARDKRGHCTALGKRPKGLCNFRKPDARWTKGKYYTYANAKKERKVDGKSGCVSMDHHRRCTKWNGLVVMVSKGGE